MLDQIDRHRRNFVVGAGGVLGGVLLASAAAASPAPKTEVRLISTYVAGAAYHEAVGCCHRLSAGEELVLRRAPDNDYDPRTVEIWTRSGAKLGRVPGNHAAMLSGLIDAGYAARARLRSVKPGNRPEIGIDIFLPA